MRLSQTKQATLNACTLALRGSPEFQRPGVPILLRSAGDFMHEKQLCYLRIYAFKLTFP